MSVSAIPKLLRLRIYARDKGRCQYCQLSQIGQGAVFHINHIIPRAKGGATEEANLVLQCPYCSLHKSDRVSGVDPQSADETPLFHPLQQIWQEHFAIEVNGICRGLTAVGRTTVEVLKMNDELPHVAQALQISLGILIPSK